MVTDPIEGYECYIFVTFAIYVAQKPQIAERGNRGVIPCQTQIFKKIIGRGLYFAEKCPPK